MPLSVAAKNLNSLYQISPNFGKTHRSSVHKTVSLRDGVRMFGTRFMGVDEEVIGIDFNGQGETQHKRTQKYNKEIGRESATHFHT